MPDFFIFILICDFFPTPYNHSYKRLMNIHTHMTFFKICNII